MDDEEKKEDEEEEKSETSGFKELVMKLREKGHSDEEIVNTLLKLADEGKVELEGKDDEDEDEKNYDEGLHAGEDKMSSWLGHKI
jgi:hypothetical protein